MWRFVIARFAVPLVRLRRDHEPVAFAVLEHRVGAPRLFLGRTFKFHAARTQLLVGLINVVARIRHVHEGADAFFIALRREQYDPRFRLRYAQLDPALFLVERLIGDDGESEFLRVKIECSILVGHRDADEFDLLDHDAPNVIPSPRLRPDAIRAQGEKVLSVYRYSS